MKHIIARAKVHLSVEASGKKGIMGRWANLIDSAELQRRLDHALTQSSPARSWLHIDRLEVDVGVVTTEQLLQRFPELVAIAVRAELERLLRRAASERKRAHTLHLGVSVTARHVTQPGSHHDRDASLAVGVEEDALPISLGDARGASEAMPPASNEHGTEPTHEVRANELDSFDVLRQSLIKCLPEVDGHPKTMRASAAQEARIARSASSSGRIEDIESGVRLQRRRQAGGSSVFQFRSEAEQCAETFIAFLDTGVMAWPWSDNIDAEGCTTLAERALAAEPAFLRARLRGLVDPATARSRISAWSPTLGGTSSAWIVLLETLGRAADAAQCLAPSPGLWPASHLTDPWAASSTKSVGATEPSSDRSDPTPLIRSPLPAEGTAAMFARAERSRSISVPEIAGRMDVWRDGVSVDTCGLAIIHPFLRPFLEAVGVMRAGRFTSDAEQARAVTLVDWIARGRAATVEHQLVLAKILCGFPVAGLVPPLSEPSCAEQQEIAGLLDHVIRSWSALKNTSATGLRQAFLMRNGILRKEGAVLSLRMEAKPWDMLIDRLPWGFSHVRLSWMRELIQVER